MKYLFPRQFGLHNVFTCTVDPKESVQPLKDYTLREQEIAQLDRQSLQKGAAAKQRIPKRLRGEALDLVRKLQRLHSRCSYRDLLKHYCPSRVSGQRVLLPIPPIDGEQRISPRPERKVVSESGELMLEQLDSQIPDPLPGAADPRPRAEPLKAHLVSLATPHSDVSAFCQGVLSNLIPNRFWGDGNQGNKNKKVVMRNVDHFIRLRRFESQSLHTVFQGLKVRLSTYKSLVLS